jgi:hypothetical protein
VTTALARGEQSAALAAPPSIAVKTIDNNEMYRDTNLLETLKASSFTADLAGSFSVFLRPTMNNQVLIDAAFRSSKRENGISRLRCHTAIVFPLNWREGWITPGISTLLGVGELRNACLVDTAFHVGK